MKGVADKSVDLVVTDAPYLFVKAQNPNTYENTKSKFGKSDLYRFDGEMLDDMGNFGKEDIYRLCNECERVTKGMHGYFFCSESQVPYYCNWALEKGYLFSILVWEKPLSIISKVRMSQNLEYIIRIYKPNYAHIFVRDNNDLYNRVAHTTPVLGKQRCHSTQKPIDLMARYILLSTEENDIVLDPFLGSGTTALACIRTKRRFIGFEKSEKYFKIASERIKAEQSQLTLF